MIASVIGSIVASIGEIGTAIPSASTSALFRSERKAPDLVKRSGAFLFGPG